MLAKEQVTDISNVLQNMAEDIRLMRETIISSMLILQD